ncbi:hypothetical protein ARMGADRAFT_1040425 [Armillaria gallica]|uniref:Uncharacterized protein n=1 Tax=Armillaria gallica TaxID=47427 RepID=A0A2H3CA45_ARMGA|nr:hypothetical protein ARMGADRAFT_1040425 [Armillaria gallica]
MKLAGAAGISKRRQRPSQNADRGPDLLQTPSPSIYGFSSSVLYDAVSWPSSIASHHICALMLPLYRREYDLIVVWFYDGKDHFQMRCSSSRHIVVQYDAWLSNETVKARNSILRAVEITDKKAERLFGEYTREVPCLLVERDDGLTNIDEDKRQKWYQLDKIDVSPASFHAESLKARYMPGG